MVSADSCFNILEKLEKQAKGLKRAMSPHKSKSTIILLFFFLEGWGVHTCKECSRRKGVTENVVLAL